MRLLALSLLAASVFGQTVSNPSNTTSNPNSIFVTNGYLYLNKVHYAGTWSSSTTYTTQDMVISSGASYISLQVGNLNHTPASSPIWWVALPGGGGSGTPGGSANQIQWNSAGSFAGFTMGGDCTIVVATGVITCTKTGGVSFATSATTDTTNAANIASGTLPAGRMPAHTGDVTSSAGAVALTLATVNSGPGACGDSTHVCAVTTNSKGLVTSQSAVSISGGSGSGVSYCAGSASTTTITCTPSPALTLAAGATVLLLPGANGAGGAMTLNVSGTGAVPIKLPDGSTNPSQIEIQSGKSIYLTYNGTNWIMPIEDKCVTGTITLSASLIANAVTQEITILAAGLPGDFLPSNAWVNITTAGTFSSTLTASMGRTGSSTYAEWVPAIDAKTIQAWGDKPTPAVFGISNTYTALVVNFTGGSALGNGATSNVSTGVAAWGFCGKRSLQ